MVTFWLTWTSRIPFLSTWSTKILFLSPPLAPDQILVNLVNHNLNFVSPGTSFWKLGQARSQSPLPPWQQLVTWSTTILMASVHSRNRGQRKWKCCIFWKYNLFEQVFNGPREHIAARLAPCVYWWQLMITCHIVPHCTSWSHFDQLGQAGS
jgi:hypothetical protein